MDKDQKTMEEVYGTINEGILDRGRMRLSGGMRGLGQRINQGAKGFMGQKTDADAITKSKVTAPLVYKLKDLFNDLDKTFGPEMASSDVGRIYPAVAVALDDLRKAVATDKLF